MIVWYRVFPWNQRDISAHISLSLVQYVQEALPILYNELLYNIGQDFMDIYIYLYIFKIASY